MALNLNKVVLCGRLTADVELKATTSGVSVCSFTLAVNRKYSKEGQKEADFINCIAWRNTAEFINKFFGKGSSICITGAIQTRSWQDQNGQKRYATEVVAEEAMFVESKSETQTEQRAPSFTQSKPEPQFENIPDDSQLPF